MAVPVNGDNARVGDLERQRLIQKNKSREKKLIEHRSTRQCCCVSFAVQSVSYPAAVLIFAGSICQLGFSGGVMSGCGLTLGVISILPSTIYFLEWRSTKIDPKEKSRFIAVTGVICTVAGIIWNSVNLSRSIHCLEATK